MNDTQKIQLITLLSDVIPNVEGDTIKAINHEVKDLTRQKLIDQLLEDRNFFAESDGVLIRYFNESIQLLQTISDDDFQTTLEEQLTLTELKIGQSIFQELDSQQLTQLRERMKEKQPETKKDDKEKSSFFHRFFKTIL